MADEQQGESEDKPKSKMMLIIIIVLVIVLAGGGAAAFFLMGGDVASEEVVEEKIAMAKPAVYFELKPPIMVHYKEKGRQRYVQISVAVMTRNDAVIDALQKHMPLVRNNLVMVFGAQDFAGLKTQEGKEALREKALEELQAIVSDEMGEPGLEKVLFTNFVMQ